MQKFIRCVVGSLLIAGSASLAAASDLKLTLDNGRATLIAKDVPLRQILDEWARIGKTTIVNGDKLTATGEFELTHAELGMKPFSVMLGALQVADKMKFAYRIEAEASPAKN